MRHGWPPSRHSRGAWRCFVTRRRRPRRSSCVAPPSCNRSPWSTCCTRRGPGRGAIARCRSSPSNKRCSRSRSGRSGATRRSPSDRTSSGSSRCGRATMSTAKKFFYEALRLDPTSEAGQQVRILARRGTAAPAQPGAEGPPRPEPPAEPAPVAAPVPAVANVPPAQAVPASPPSKAPSSGGEPVARAGRGASRDSGDRDLRRGETIAARGAVRTERSPSPRSPSTRLRPLSRNARTRPRHRHLKATKAMSRQGPGRGRRGRDMGTVLLPPRAAGHRIFVDGRRAKTDGSEPLCLRCGRHAIQIGSSGTPETIELPCGGEVQLQ